MMAALKGIPIKVQNGPVDDGGSIGGGLIAILREIAEMLERLEQYDESGAIDLRSLPFSPDDYARLRDVLGSGEVEITLDADGISRLRETAYSGVWWIQHRNTDDELTAELLEIALVPAIAVTAKEDVAQSASRLKNRLSIHTTGRSAQ
jgi:hydrogenase-1 operon protein HyaF